MKVTIIEVGEVPDPLQPTFGSYPKMFETMFANAGAPFTFDTVHVNLGAPMPRADDLEAILVPGSAAGVYDDFAWMNPLRELIRGAYANSVPMMGVCFGHQIMADALGGDVRKSEKGWGIGRHVYDFNKQPDFAKGLAPKLAIAASHQDQVITAPKVAEVFLSSDFTPNAGLIYKNGKAMSVQPHPEFGKDYAIALAELRRNNPLTDAQVEKVEQTLEKPLDSPEFAKAMTRFFQQSS